MVYRFGILAFLALGLQLLAILGPLGSSDVPRRIALSLSYLLLLAFIAVNPRRPGLVVIGVGALLNFLAIVSNGGLMPITPHNLERSGHSEVDVSPGDWVPDSKDVLLARDDTRLYFLTDTLVRKNATGINAFSIGDVIIGAGLIVTLGELLLPRVQRVSRDGPSPT